MISQSSSDSSEREQALAPHLSFIVQAPAGSGKTGLLVQRILRLLSVVERPESIVAVTFTIKAAAEMRERVVRALVEAANDALLVRDSFHERTIQLARSALARDRAQAWNLTTDPSRLHIQTIDALCANLVRQMPLVSESGGIGGVTEDAEEFYRQAARQALQKAAEGVSGSAAPALFHRLALHFDNNIAGLESQIAAMLAKRDQWHIGMAGPMDVAVADFTAILGHAERELHDVFRNRNTVDFTQVTRSAITALGDPEAPSDLLYALDYRIEHLLVDEFQDTSRAQYDLLGALTGQWSDEDGRTLFLVGDPLQSIYRFRAAEVALFQRCWDAERLGAVRLHPLRLLVNFRSTSQIVKWVQTELAPALNETDISRGAVKLQPSIAARQTTGPVPMVIPLLDDKSGSQEADQVVALLHKQKDRGEAAILVRSRSHVLRILQALRQAGIRYQAVEIDPLGEQQHILDLLSLTRALTHLADRIAWLACLRAPWCGLTLADLTALAEGEKNRTIFDLISDPEIIRRLSPPGRFRTVAAQAVLTGALDRIGRTSLRELLQETWYALGGPAILAQKNQQQDVETFFDLVENLEEGGMIRDFRQLNDRLCRLYARPDSSKGAVRVMTIHEAKGLEFDTVILPHLGSAPRGDDEELLVWNEIMEADGSVNLQIAAQPRRGEPDAAYNSIREAAKQKTRNEGKRLFYVACTRARNQLFLLGSVNRNKKRTDVCNAAVHTFLGMIWQRFKPDFKRLQMSTFAVQADLFEQARTPQTISRLPGRWHPPAFDASLDWQPHFDRGKASERQVTYAWVGGASRHVGTLVHGLLNRVARDGTNAWHPGRIDALEASMRAELSRLGVGASVQMHAAGQVLRAIRNTVDSQRGQWILQPHQDARSEWPVTGVLGSQLISGTVDRLFRDAVNRLWVVDFKTSEHQGGSVDAFLDRERERYREQMETYAALLARSETGPISLGLYFPLLDAWREWEWAESAASAT